MKRETKSRLDILGKQIDVTIYACPNCFPTDEDIKKITKAVGAGKKEGDLESHQPDKDGFIYGRWRVVLEDLKPGDRVTFSTSGKYNPGFHTTDTYEGVIRFKTASGHWMIGTDGGECAVVPTRHIEKLIP